MIGEPGQTASSKVTEVRFGSWSCKNGAAGYQVVVIIGVGGIFDVNKRHWHLSATVGIWAVQSASE